MEGFLDIQSPQIWDLLNKLNPDTSALWGTMTAQHMVEHLIIPIKIARGEFQVSLATPEEKVERVKNLMLLSAAPLKKGFAAPFLPEGLMPLKYEDLPTAIKALQSELDLFFSFFQDNPSSTAIHPVFGSLGKEEWYLFQSKHFTHHLSQFGLY
ncbi:MAG: DUF1569 domain-containing protein [Bacteroidota bacterium]|nr:DUF1569 domain-containing protein [Bacteroidota bacterium]